MPHYVRPVIRYLYIRQTFRLCRRRRRCRRRRFISTLYRISHVFGSGAYLHASIIIMTGAVDVFYPSLRAIIGGISRTISCQLQRSGAVFITGIDGRTGFLRRVIDPTLHFRIRNYGFPRRWRRPIGVRRPRDGR
jgi:hypothetical protein